MKNYFLRMSMIFAFISTNLFTLAEAQTQNRENILIHNTEHYAAYRIDGRNIIFTLELINDFTDNTKGDSPNVDSVGISVDADQNAEVTNGVDTAYGIKGKPVWMKIDWEKHPFVKGICTQFLIDGKFSSPCGKLSSKASLDFGFRATVLQSAAHPVYIFTIPASEISADGRSADIKLMFYSAGKGYTFYPAKEKTESWHSFAKVLKIKL